MSKDKKETTPFGMVSIIRGSAMTKKEDRYAKPDLDV